MAASYLRQRPLSETALRVEVLLARYPNLGEGELAELINLFPTLSMLDQALLTSDDHVAARLREFHVEHRDKLKTQLAGLIAFLSLPALLVIGLLWWVFA